MYCCNHNIVFSTLTQIKKRLVTFNAVTAVMVMVVIVLEWAFMATITITIPKCISISLLIEMHKHKGKRAGYYVMCMLTIVH